MKQTTMCLLSGFFGALFAVACGAVNGLDKEANADSTSLQIKSKTFDCDGYDLSGGDLPSHPEVTALFARAPVVKLSNPQGCDFVLDDDGQYYPDDNGDETVTMYYIE